MIENITLIADNEAANVDSINSRLEKANTNFNDLNSTKADKTTVYTKQETDKKLTEQKNHVDTELAKKAKQFYVDAELSTKSEYNTATCKVNPPDYDIAPSYPKLAKTQNLFDLKFIPPTDFDGKTLWVPTGGGPGYRFTLYNSDGEKVQAGDGWKANVPVTIIFNKLTKKAFFKSGGTGVNQTLPPQIRSFAVTPGDAQNKLSWLLPVDTTAYEGLTIVRKIGSAPTKLSDGTKFSLSKTATSYTDTGLTNNTKYYYRAFPCNSKKQYQTELIGAVVSGTPQAEMPISNLPVGTLVKDINTKYYDEPIAWKIADKNHSTYPSNSVTLITNKIIKMGCADAKEPGNVHADRVKYGNNRYSHSNARQWLNSQQTANQWYIAQHQHDAPPDKKGTTANPYVNKNGFLHSFSQGFLSLLMTTSITIAKCNRDGGGIDTIQDKMFLLSDKEVGNVITSNANDYCEVNDTVLTLFNNVTDNERIADVAQSVLDNDTNTTKRWFLRFPFDYGANRAHTYCCVSETGSTSSQSAEMGTTGFRPACNIKNNALVSVRPDTDGAYIIQS